MSFWRIPWSILLSALLLMLLGLSGIARGDDLFGRGAFYSRQLMWVALSLPAMILAMLVPYRTLRHFSIPAAAISLLLLVVVLLMPSVNGARCWIPLGFVNFQPSELSKLVFVLVLANHLMFRDHFRRLTGLMVPFLLTLIPVGLILREPDLGTALLFVPTLFAMLFTAGARPRHLVSIAMLGVAASPLLWMQMNSEQKSRIVSLFQQKDGGEAPKGDAHQQHQAKRTLALGGVWGSAITELNVHSDIVHCPDCAAWMRVARDVSSRESVECSKCGKRFVARDRAAYFLPESRTDFIFCLIGERWGLVGCGVTLLLYLVIFARGLLIAARTQDPFGRLVAVGIVTLLASQTMINTGMTVGLMPVTGITLPLASYGGSSLMMTAISVGLLINIGMRRSFQVTGEPFRWRAATA